MTATPPRTWIEACAEFGAEHGVPPETLEALRAFASPHPRGGPPIPPEAAWSKGFEALRRTWSEPIDIDTLTQLLAPEAEGRQPSTFARRTAATEGILERLGTPAAQILQIGLRVRLDGIRAAPPPRLKRVRALADFYYSLAARLLHPQWTEEPQRLVELVKSARWRTVAAGLEHATLDGLADGMPVHVNVLRVEPAHVSVVVRDLTSMTRAGQSFAEAVGPSARAAVSGGFFLYSENDIEPPSRRHDPVGLLVVDGDVRSAPVFRRASLLVGERGDIELRVVGLDDVPIKLAGRSVTLGAHWNRARAERGPDEEAIAVVGSRVVAVGRSLPVPLNGFVATLAGRGAAGVEVGDPVSYVPPQLTSGGPAVHAIAGGPTLVRDGRAVLDMRAEDFWGTAPPITFSQDETGDRNLLARMAVGVDGAGRLVAVAVDGRNVERALGMTLGDVARLLIHVGCGTAMSLDGGSSKRMLVEGRVVDLPSTEIIAGEADLVRVRPVHSAILFRPRATPAQRD